MLRRSTWISFSFLAAALVASFVACSDEDPAAVADVDDAGTAGRDGSRTEPGSDADPGVPTTCTRTPKPDDHVRKVVVSHPFAEEGKAKRFEVLELSEDGVLSKTDQVFEMRTAYSDIVWTADGKVGFVAQDDSTIGVFAFGDDGKVKVVHEGFSGDFAASELLVSADGQHLWVLDSNVEANGGGLRRMRIACDGSLTDEGLVVPGGTAHAMTYLPGDPTRAVYVSYKASDSPADTYVHTLDLGASPPKRLASGPVFDDADALASSVAVTPDGKFALVTDNGFLRGSRMAPVALTDMTKRASIDTPNPVAVVTSPFGNSLLLVNSDGEDAMHVVHYDPANDAAPFTIGPEIAMKGGKTEIPQHPQLVTRGKLKGRVLVAEVLAVRQLAFAADGSITDVDAKLTWPDGFTNIVGSLGVEP